MLFKIYLIKNILFKINIFVNTEGKLILIVSVFKNGKSIQEEII